MHLALALTLALVPAHEDRSTISDEELGAVSANGQFEARIARAPGQERVADRLARHLITVRARAADPAAESLWSCHYPGLPDAAGHHLLSDDGSTFVAVSRAYQLARPVVRVFRFGAEVGEYAGRDVELERDEFTLAAGGTHWLDDPGDRLELVWHDRLDGPSLVLELESVRGWERALDLTAGGFIGEQARAAPVLHPGIDPKLRGVVRVPTVVSFMLPKQALAGVPVELLVEGKHPTTNWQLCGFKVDVLDVEGFELRIVPQTRPPTPGSMVGPALTAYRGKATLYGLVPGRYLIRVEGSESRDLHLPSRTLVVLPARIRARLRITGGIAGIDETLELFVPGVVRSTRARADPDSPPRLAQVSPAVLEDVDRALLALGGERPASQSTSGAMDLFQYDLEWWAGDAWRHVGRDDGTARGPVGDLIHALRRAAR